jgi:hypothetical protein
MNKRNIRYQPRVVSSEPSDSEEPIVSQRLLHNIQQKLEKSSALNGGFDRLLYKIDSIENNQNAIAGKVDKIHDAIYDPDEGLFARIATNKADQVESVNKIEKRVIEISTWKDQKDKDTSQTEDTVEKFNTKMFSLENDIQSLNRFKLAAIGLTKWILAAVGGGTITILFKVLYDYVIVK